MGKETLMKTMKSELGRIDDNSIDKRHEVIIEGFTDHNSPRAIKNGKEYLIFNSNDYLGLRFSKENRKGEEEASKKFGTGPGAVRFISGTLSVHRDLEKSLAEFHGRDDAMVFSSAFAVNMAVLHCLIKGQSRDSMVENNTLVISDALNHRSIIDGIRVANLPKENRKIFTHMDMDNLKEVLEENKGKFKRCIIVTDGVFSMLGEYQDLKALQEVADAFDSAFEEGVITVVDDAHGVAAFGSSGRGTEEMTGGKVDVLIGTMGKGFGADGGYVTANQTIIDYLRESAATYIYSNSISPGTAGAALNAVELIKNDQSRLKNLKDHIEYFKSEMKKIGFVFACDSVHPIQPVLIGDAKKTKDLAISLLNEGIIVTNINFPVVPKGKDEIRVQLSAIHTKEDIDLCIAKFAEAGKSLGII